VGWTYEPLPLALIAVAALLYDRRLRTLRRRGRPVPPPRILAFAGGLAVLVLALVSPLDTVGETRLFSVHMAQHVLIGDVAPLLLALGLTGPIVRPLLAIRWLWRLRFLTHPLVALPLWALQLWVWHLPWLYDAALRHPVVHSLQHASFLTCGLLLWSTLLGLLPGPRWFRAGSRLAALGAVWVVGGVLANVFLWSSSPYYQPYVHAPRTLGLSALDDQRAGGGVMLLEMMLVGVVVFVALGLEWLSESGRREQPRPFAWPAEPGTGPGRRSHGRG
jgi:putative membrane protein